MESVWVPPLQTLLHPPLLFRWEGKGDWCNPIRAVLDYAARITNNKLQLNQELWVQYDFIAIHAGSTNVEDTIIYFVSKFIVDYAFLL